MRRWPFPRFGADVRFLGALVVMLGVTVANPAAISAAVADPAATAVAEPAITTARTVDLRDAAALAELQRTRPAHYATIRQILADLQQQPDRAEGDWLQAHFDVRDVELSRLLLKTSYPPRQLLRFTLDDTRYTLHVTRSDLVAQPTVLH